MNLENYIEFEDMLNENTFYDDFDRVEHAVYGLSNGNTYIDCLVNAIEAAVTNINDISEKCLDKIVNRVIFPDKVKSNTVSSNDIKNIVETYIGYDDGIGGTDDMYDDDGVYDPEMDVEDVEIVNEEEPGEALQDNIEADMEDEVEDELQKEEDGVYDPDLDVEDETDPAVEPEGEDFEDLDDPVDTEEDDGVYDPDLDVDDDDDDIEYELDADGDIDDIYDPELDLDEI